MPLQVNHQKVMGLRIGRNEVEETFIHSFILGQALLADRATETSKRSRTLQS